MVNAKLQFVGALVFLVACEESSPEGTGGSSGTGKAPSESFVRGELQCAGSTKVIECVGEDVKGRIVKETAGSFDCHAAGGRISGVFAHPQVGDATAWPMGQATVAGVCEGATASDHLINITDAASEDSVTIDSYEVTEYMNGTWTNRDGTFVGSFYIFVDR